MEEKEYKDTLDTLLSIINCALKGNNEEEVIDYVHKMLKCNFVFYNYVRDNIILKGSSIAEITEDKNNFSYEIELKNSLIGKFILAIHKDSITDLEKSILSRAGMIISIMYKDRFSSERVAKDLKKEFLIDICTGNLKSRDEFKVRRKLTNCEITENLVSVIFDLDEYKKKTIELNESGKKIEIIKDKMFKYLKTSFLNAGFIFYTFQNSDSIIFLFENNKTFIDNKDTMIKQVTAETLENYNFSYTVGIGRSVEDIFDVPISHNEAREAVKIGRSMLGLGLVHEYKDLELFSILNHAVNTDSLSGELMRPIRNIISYDTKNDTDYYNFLKVLINSNWSLTKTAEISYIHYNTAKYRLKKTEEIIGLSMDNANNRFKLELAFRLYELKSMT